jgi:hypothetical protein
VVHSRRGVGRRKREGKGMREGEREKVILSVLTRQELLLKETERARLDPSDREGTGPGDFSWVRGQGDRKRKTERE